MSDLKLRVRYYQDSTPADVPCREENFIRREIDMTLPLEQTALVLVDLWSSATRPEWWDIDGKRLPRLPVMFFWCFGDGVAPGGPLL